MPAKLGARLPPARVTDLVVKRLDAELLVYDLANDKAFSLNETSRLVFDACDGKTTFDDLQDAHPQLDENVIQLALRQLSRQNLLVDKFESGPSRRELLRKATLTAAALPVVSGLLTPTPAQAQSCAIHGVSCTTVADCCSGLACQNVASLGVMCCDPPGGACTFPRPDLCCSGCCTASGAPPGSAICC